MTEPNQQTAADIDAVRQRDLLLAWTIRECDGGWYIQGLYYGREPFASPEEAADRLLEYLRLNSEFNRWPPQPKEQLPAKANDTTDTPETLVPKTRGQIEALKQNWVNDPCWDIDKTEGFEAHESELLTYRLEWEARWRQRADARLGKKAERLGCPGNLKLAAYVERLESRLRRLEEERP